MSSRPATPREVAAFLDTSVAVVKRHWPEDAVPVVVGERTAYLLQDDLAALERASTAPTAAESTVRFLGPYDLLMQVRDRETLEPDRARRRALYAVLGRPGPVVADGTVLGTWRPRASGGRLTVLFEPWARITHPVQASVDAGAERLAVHRGVTLAGVERL
jgi:hypothetical protein